MTLIAELKRRYVIRAAKSYIDAVWTQNNTYFDQITRSPTPSKLSDRLLDAALSRMR